MKNTVNVLKIAGFTAAILMLLAASAFAQRVKDIAHVKAEQMNIIDGFGLVTGLQGTGDGDTELVRGLIVNLYKRYNISVSTTDIKAKNVAVVRVSARVRSGVREGMLIDVQVASHGEASSLKGGYLNQAYLWGPDRKMGPLALAYGALDVSGKDVLTKGTVTNGGIMTGNIPITYANEQRVDPKAAPETISWVLEKPDTRTAVQVAIAFRNAYMDLDIDNGSETPGREDIGSVINKFAAAKGNSEIVVRIPESYKDRLSELVAILNSRTVTGVDVEARVIINLAKRTIVINGNVRIGECAIVADGIEVIVPPAAEKVVGVGASDRNGEEGVSLVTLRKILNKIGVSNETLITIITEINRAGKLYGKLEVN